MASIYPFFTWCEQTRVYKVINAHESFFPALETLHLFGLVLLLGTIAVLSLRLLGVLMPHRPVSEFASALDRYLTLGLCIMLPSGALMFVATAVRCYGNTSFCVKMGLLTAALILFLLLPESNPVARIAQQSAARQLCWLRRSDPLVRGWGGRAIHRILRLITSHRFVNFR